MSGFFTIVLNLFLGSNNNMPPPRTSGRGGHRGSHSSANKGQKGSSKGTRATVKCGLCGEQGQRSHFVQKSLFRLYCLNTNNWIAKVFGGLSKVDGRRVWDFWFDGCAAHIFWYILLSIIPKHQHVLLHILFTCFIHQFFIGNLILQPWIYTLTYLNQCLLLWPLHFPVFFVWHFLGILNRVLKVNCSHSDLSAEWVQLSIMMLLLQSKMILFTPRIELTTAS